MAKIADFFVELGLKKDKYDKGMEDANKAPQKLNSLFGGLGAGIVTAFAGVATISALTSFTKQVVGIASQAEAVRKAFERIDGDKYLQGLRDATRGTVTDLELMKRAVMAENFQIPLEQLGSLFEFARRRAEETGQSVDYLVNSIVTGIGRKSPLILDNLGISAVALKDKMNGVTMETASIGDVATAVGSIARDQLASMGDEAVTVGQKLAGVATKWENIKLRIGEAIIESGAFNLSIDTLTGIMDNFEAKSILKASMDISLGMDQFVKDFQSGKVSVEEAETKIVKYSQTMSRLAPLFDSFWDGFFNIERANEAQKLYDKIFNAWVELQHALLGPITVPNFDYDKLTADAEAAAKLAAAEAAKIAAEAEKKKYEAWLKTNEGIREQNELAEINGEVMRKSLQGAIADMEALTKAANDKAEAWKTAMNQVFAPDEEGNIDDGTDAITSKFSAIKERTQSFVDDMNQMTSDFIADFISGMAEGIGLLLTGDIGFDTLFNMVLGSFGSFMKQMGALMIAYGVAQTAFWSSMAEGPLGAVKLIAAGVAMVAIGAAISSLGKNPGKAMGGGGGGSTAGMAGGGGGYQNQVTGYGNQGGFGYTLDTKISGDDLLVIMQRAERNNKRRV